VDFNKELSRQQSDDDEDSSPFPIARSAPVDPGSGPSMGASRRRRGSPKKTFKK